jgi:hypothetical protein
MRIAATAKRQVTLRDGKIFSDTEKQNPEFSSQNAE